MVEFSHSVQALKFRTRPQCQGAQVIDRKFTFLSVAVTFENRIDWNYADKGKLWLYNLNYFEFLHQEDLPKIEKEAIIRDFTGAWPQIRDGREPYPSSLRIINWIRYLTRNPLDDHKITDTLYSDAYYLSKRFEYHLLANHLLENAFALFMAGYYFQQTFWINHARKILKDQLVEQVLTDGMHFERSPMYHQIILYRVLECLDLVTSNSAHETDKTFQKFLEDKASIMIGCLNQLQMRSGEVPLINDSTNKIAIRPEKLYSMAQQLELRSSSVSLSSCGYTRWQSDTLLADILIDLGIPSPSYQPGHSHAGTFSFVIHVDDGPLIVDPGISTYENNDRRAYERSTLAHNTVSVGGENSSQVWGSFRVGRRPKVKVIERKDDYLLVEHDGFTKSHLIHQRTFQLTQNEFIVTDRLTGNRNDEAVSSIHFHPNVQIEEIDETYRLNGKWILKCEGANKTLRSNYKYATTFNQLVSAEQLTFYFVPRHSLKLLLSLDDGIATK